MTQSTSEAPAVGASSESALGSFRPSVMHVCYYVANVERALSFYVGVLGMTEQLRLELGNGVHEVVLGFADRKGSGVILMWDTKRTAPYEHGDSYSRLVLRVSDVEAATRAVESRGVRVVKPPTDVPGLRYSMLHDPDGHVVELLELRR